MLHRPCSFGCGLSCPAGWCNYGNSFRLRLQRLPVIGGLVPSGPYGRFPADVRYGDIVRGLPRPPGSVKLLYCSHVLEHLALEELRQALRHCHALLAHDGIFRLVPPDLEHLIRCYTESSASDRGFMFISHTGMGVTHRSARWLGRVKETFASSRHVWLWDYPALATELTTAGFHDIRRATHGDSGIAAFDAVEAEPRWRHALGIQCRR
jgi:hypothetical protein